MQNEQTQTVVTPKVSPKEEVFCPFYGMILVDGSFVEKGGNCCALKKDQPLSCYMKDDRLEPSFRLCAHGSRERRRGINELLEGATAFPNRFRPPGISGGWSGISAKAWFDFVVRPPW